MLRQLGSRCLMDETGEAYSEPCQNSEWFSVVDCLYKKLHVRYLTGFWICLLLILLPLQEPVTNNNFLLSQPWIISPGIWFHFHNHRQGQRLNNSFANTLSSNSAARFTKFSLKFIAALKSCC